MGGGGSEGQWAREPTAASLVTGSAIFTENGSKIMGHGASPVNESCERVRHFYADFLSACWFIGHHWHSGSGWCVTKWRLTLISENGLQCLRNRSDNMIWDEHTFFVNNNSAWLNPIQLQGTGFTATAWKMTTSFIPSLSYVMRVKAHLSREIS